MPAHLTLEWNSKELSVFRDKRVEKALLRTISKAGGDAARFLKSGSSKLIRQRKALKVARINKSLPLLFPRGRQHLNDLVWTMRVSGEPIPVIAFPTRQTKRGVVAQINTGRRTLIKGAFIAVMRSGHKGVFRRRGDRRLPIDEAFTTRVSDVFKDNGFIPFVQAGAQVRFKASFERLLPLELAK
jgi:hypothetical protein